MLTQQPHESHWIYYSIVSYVPLVFTAADIQRRNHRSSRVHRNGTHSSAISQDSWRQIRNVEHEISSENAHNRSHFSTWSSWFDCVNSTILAWHIGVNINLTEKYTNTAHSHRSLTNTYNSEPVAQSQQPFEQFPSCQNILRQISMPATSGSWKLPWKKQRTGDALETWHSVCSSFLSSVTSRGKLGA